MNLSCLVSIKVLSTIATTSLVSFTAHAEGKPSIEMPVTYQQCVACHGDVGQGNSQLKAPALAGLSQKYLTRQLTNFKTGLRGSHEKDTLGLQMQPFAKAIDNDKDVYLLTSYLANLPIASTEPTIKGDLKNGSRYYQGKCGACHGGTAQGNESMNAPKLAGQDTDYLKRQMQNFTSGVRGTHADDKLGRQMAMMAKTTSGKELDDILYYIAVQK
ncbi:c-type cytochrome [Litorilituus lipolyticus]|nr:c-type cytochrome [Litorilituus lipolyticus]